MTSELQYAQLVELLQRPATYGIVKAGEFQATGVPMLRGGDIKGGRIGQRLPYVTKQKSDEFSRTVLRAKDVVVALVGYPGDSAVVPDWLVGANISRAVGLLRPSRALLPEYLVQYLNSPVGRAEFLKPSAGSAQIVVNLADLNKLRIPLPRLEEQCQIANALGDIDALIASIERMIAKKQAIKQGMMQELLTGKTRLPGFAGDWELREFASVLYALNTRSSQVDASEYASCGSIPVVDQGKVKVCGYVSNGIAIRPGSAGVIVFGDHTCVAKFVDFDFMVGADGTKVLAARTSCDARFLFYALQLNPIVSTGYNRHYALLRERSFSMPVVAEQRAIADVLSDVDSEIESLNTRLDKARAIKQGMMQELLTGRTRLVPQGAMA